MPRLDRLNRSVLFATLAAGLAAISVVSALGVVRLFRWVVDPRVSAEVLFPFARAVLEEGVQAAVLIGIPLGFVWAVASALRSGPERSQPEQRTELDYAAGLGKPLAALSRLRVALSVCVVAAVVVSLGFRSESDRPGQFANELIQAARVECARDRSESVLVPIVDLTWNCAGGEPRITGRAPGLSAKASLEAAALRASDDLSEMVAERLRIQAPIASTLVRLEVASAHFRGLPRWGHQTGLSFGLRLATVVLTALITTLVAVGAVARLSLPRGWALAWGVLPGLVAARALGSAETPLFAIVSAIFGALGALGLLEIGARVARTWSSERVKTDAPAG
jgi:hypothetical protein